MNVQLPHRSFHPRRPLPPVTLAFLAIMGGCASLDPKPDMGRAASTVGERSGGVDF